MSLSRSAFAVATTASTAVSFYLLTACTLPATSRAGDTTTPDPNLGHDTPVTQKIGDDQDATPPDPGDPDAGDSSTGPYPNFECGVSPVYGQDSGAAYVSDAGVVTFEPVAPGHSAVYQVAVQDSADVSETILSATVTGSGAGSFHVLSSFPIPVPAGQQALVAVQFFPTDVGTYSAELVLQTANMGPSPVALTGTSE